MIIVIHKTLQVDKKKASKYVKSTLKWTRLRGLINSTLKILSYDKCLLSAFFKPDLSILFIYFNHSMTLFFGQIFKERVLVGKKIYSQMVKTRNFEDRTTSRHEEKTSDTE